MAVDAEHDAAIVDEHVVDLAGAGRRVRDLRREIRDFLRLVRVRQVEGPRPPLKNVPSTMVSDFQQPSFGRFSHRLCAPNRPPRRENTSTGGSGQVAIGTGFSSARLSTIHTSFGQSAPSLRVASSLTTSRLRSKNGTTVWVKPGFGGW